MDWLTGLARAIEYVESRLTEELDAEAIARSAFSSASHFQTVFHIVTGMTAGEYVRNRRMSEAAKELRRSGVAIADLAAKYRYETRESFSKAFARLYGVPPSRARGARLPEFRPLAIRIEIEGGFAVKGDLIERFLWNDPADARREGLTDAQRYERLVAWAGGARGRNPDVFDALTEWILDDAEWTEERVEESGQILFEGVFARFKAQNAELRSMLRALEPSGVVNEAVFKALDRFDAELGGETSEASLKEAVSAAFADVRRLADRRVRELIAGNKTGSAGVNHVDVFGYVNLLKDCDAAVQWALFMPDAVRRQQKGFRLMRLEAVKAPAMRFIGRECPSRDSDEEAIDPKSEFVAGIMRALDAMPEFASDLPCDAVLAHHFGRCVDVEPCHIYWGRFMKAGTPVPEGFDSIDFADTNDGAEGLPFLSHYAYAEFEGDLEAMHRQEGYDVDAMYDVTRNTMLGKGWNIPYPHKYWTAELFLNGHKEYSTAFLFGAEFP